jgi:hypothetical protein
VRPLEIGRYKIKAPLTSLSLDEVGVEGGKMDGNIGGSLLREFTWIYDVPHKVVYVEPNRWFGSPDLEDHSGLVLDTRGGVAKVLFVFPNSPAARANISNGDELSGKAGEAFTTDQWHDLFDDAPGTTISLRVKHAGETRTALMTLAAYI